MAELPQKKGQAGLIPEAEEVASPVQLKPEAEGTASMNQSTPVADGVV